MEDNSLDARDRYDGPALFIAGGRSAYVVTEGREAIERHFSAARIETIEAAGLDYDALIGACLIAAAERQQVPLARSQS